MKIVYLCTMNLKAIKTEKEYQQALERLKQIFDAKKGTRNGDELEALSIIIDNYKSKYYPI